MTVKSGMGWRGVKSSLEGLCRRSSLVSCRPRARDARARVRAGKIQHYELAEVVDRALEYAGKAFNEDREAERNGRVPKGDRADLMERGAGEGYYPMVHNSGTNGQSIADGTAPDSSQ